MYANTTQPRWYSIAVGSLGNILEWYDFSLYAYLAPTFAKLFFPGEDHLTAIIMVFGIFGAGFIVRPLGGLFFGYIGDRYGRSRALQLTVLLMSIPTLLTVLLPTFAQVGVYAPLLLVLTRLLQGLSVGGEAAGSVIYLGEMAPNRYRGFVTSLTNAGSNIGVLTATGFAALSFHWLSSSQMDSWGWRMLYLLGAIMGVVFIYCRRHLAETPFFLNLNSRSKQDTTKTHNESAKIKSKAPIIDVLQTAKWPIVRVVLFVCMGAGLFYIGYVYLPTYLQDYSGITMASALGLVTAYNILSLLLIPFFGWLSDCFGRKILVIGAGLVFCFVILCFHWMANAHGNWLWIILGSFLLTLFSNIEQGIMPVILVETFPKYNRYTGLALGYNIAYSLLGGMAPMVVSSLIKITHSPIAPGYYLMVVASITGVTLFFTRFPTQLKT